MESIAPCILQGAHRLLKRKDIKTLFLKFAQAGQSGGFGNGVVLDQVVACGIGAEHFSAGTRNALNFVRDRFKQFVSGMIFLLQYFRPACAGALKENGDFLAGVFKIVILRQTVEHATQ